MNGLARVSSTDLWEPEGVVPLGYSTGQTETAASSDPITGGELHSAAEAGRTRAAEGNNRQQIFRCWNRTDPISAFAKNAGAPDLLCLELIGIGQYPRYDT